MKTPIPALHRVPRPSIAAVFFSALCLACALFSAAVLSAQQPATLPWTGILHTATGQPIPAATLHLSGPTRQSTAVTRADGSFSFEPLPSGSYQLTVDLPVSPAAAPQPILLAAPVLLGPASAPVALTLTSAGALTLTAALTQATKDGGEVLSSRTVSEVPLNKRDFSQLLLLAAGTMTDSNGATNFTQQFAINGQRGVEAVFAMDGADTSDPEMGGATFSNFNVDAVQEIQSSSGWMPAEIGRGAAGFTNIVTRSGSSGFHGSAFEFLRNSALDARNYFDYPSLAQPGRIPPFRRNEFGFTNGGPVVLPHLYDGRSKTFYFGQYQGFRQVLGTTQNLPVPTPAERTGLDTTAYPGDTLFIPVDPDIAAILRRYPQPNNPSGIYQGRTYATSSKVVTNANQFSIRLDHRLSGKSQLFLRFNYNNLSGPTTNPDQTAIDESFGVRYIDRQRNLALTYTRVASPRLTLQSGLSITRTTPMFPTPNRTDPALKFNDGLYESFNSAAGSVMTAFGNLFQGWQNVSLTTARHAFRAGVEARLNRDTTYFGTSPNGEFDFGGGKAYSRIDIPSRSGQHDIHAGDLLPDTLSSLLSGSPFAYTVAVAPPYFSNGEHIGAAAVDRNNVNFYAQDTWKLSSRFTLDYGLRYEIYTPIAERAKRTSRFIFINDGGQTRQQYVVNPQPGYDTSYTAFGPRVQINWRATANLFLHAGGAITTIPPNIWQDNYLTGSTPFVVYPRLTSAPGAPIVYGSQITPSQLPAVYTPAGDVIFDSTHTRTKSVPANTVMDVNRYDLDVAALSPSHQVAPLNLSGIDRHFGNGYLQTWTLGIERHFGALDANAAYVGTAAVKLPRTGFPNAYPGADAQFARYTDFDPAGNIIGGFGTESLILNNAHSTYHALQTSLQGTVPHGGPGVQASYTWGKSLDETSSVAGGGASTGAVAQAFPQNPFDTRAEKGPSTFDVAHAFTLNVAQDLHLESVGLLEPLHRKATAGWSLLSISSINSGAPFTVYSGVQQTGAGSSGVDRPDQIAKPRLSTARKVREDYFGRGLDNASFFSIPGETPSGIDVATGRFGTLGRNTFRGPAYYNYDFAFIKDTPIGTRRGGAELINVQFRGEFFNLFNIVNMGLPSNTIRGSGFGQINRTAGTSRQIQFSLKIIY